ncbi:hypothetical protein J25TS5_20790 [Paenibacillus faecis]|uniref:hypothetical protein n=1 Tax=Paenibacillus faecis TaxID=862114 RepID=UPI001B1E2F65|nr:hypothetical protein [Paenibacillus faecis]GIO85147.1 hypothetical protein J25TS5_20790 [Paenibacillus faecis]
MRNTVTERRATYGRQPVLLGDKAIADIVITHHARLRYQDRVDRRGSATNEIARWAWGWLKQGRMKPYYRNGEDVYLVDDDLVFVAEFTEIPGMYTEQAKPVYKMIIVTFLGRMSETIELRDLKSYYSWLRHSRRMTLMKNTRKRK